jgi:DNA-binding transcriptional ArsR family regulator
MNITNEMAELLLRQSELRSGLLNPLKPIAETCWLLMLNLFGNQNTAQSAAQLASALDMNESTLLRYLAVLKDAGFIVLQSYKMGQAECYSLSEPTHLAVTQILEVMVQDVISSFGT